VIQSAWERIAFAATVAQGDRGRVVCLNIHNIFLDVEEMHAGPVDPLESITLTDLRHILEFFHSSGYKFLHLKQLLNRDFDRLGRYLLLTFDDGAANVLRALPLLRSFEAPAVFFITTSNMVSQEKFWWNMAYQSHRMRRLNAEEIKTEKSRFRELPPQEIVSILQRESPEVSCASGSDLDRPMTRKEVSDLASDPLFEIGNHCHDHVRLGKCGEEEMADQILKSQTLLKDVLDVAPTTISFPHGSYNATAIGVAKEAGFQACFTSEFTCFNIRARALGREMLLLGRFGIDLSIQNHPLRKQLSAMRRNAMFRCDPIRIER